MSTETQTDPNLSPLEDTHEGSHEHLLELFPLSDGIGSVSLVQHVGDDSSIVRAARVSFAGDLAPFNLEKDAKLIKYLLKHQHGSPFEHNLITFRVRCPVYVDRQWVRHRVGLCLAGDTVVTFVNTNGEGLTKLSKTMKELYDMWTQGEAHSCTAESEKVSVALSTYQEFQGSIGAMKKAEKASGLSRGTIRRYLAGSILGFRSSQKRLQNMKLRVLNEETGLFEVGHVADVMFQGEQPVYRVTLDDGKTLTMTRNHRVLTSEGWSTMGDALDLKLHGQTATMGKEAFFMVNGLAVYRDLEWMASQRQQGKCVQEMANEAECSYHTIRKWLKIHDLRFSSAETRFSKGNIPWNMERKGYRLKRVYTEEHRAITRAARSGEKSNFWRGGTTSDRANINRWTSDQSRRVHEKFNFTCHNCGSKQNKLCVHHVVPVWADQSLAYEFSNLVTVCVSCHKEIHKSKENEEAFARKFDPTTVISGVRQKQKGNILKAHPVKVVAVEYLGIQPTYDLEVAGSWHNFVANGIVVHNSKNEESGRYITLREECYIPGQFRKQAKNNRQASNEDDGQIDQDQAHALYEAAWKNAFQTYQSLLELGVAREQARGVLPLSLYTSSYYTFNLRSLFHFLELRDHEGAQWEIRLYARALAELAEPLFPAAFAAWRELHAEH